MILERAKQKKELQTWDISKIETLSKLYRLFEPYKTKEKKLEIPSLLPGWEQETYDKIKSMLQEDEKPSKLEEFRSNMYQNLKTYTASSLEKAEMDLITDETNQIYQFVELKVYLKND